jgi:hypothetical protein
MRIMATTRVSGQRVNINQPKATKYSILLIKIGDFLFIPISFLVVISLKFYQDSNTVKCEISS